MVLGSVSELFVRMSDTFERVHISWLIAPLRVHIPGEQPARVTLFEKHPEDEVLEIETMSGVSD